MYSLASSVLFMLVVSARASIDFPSSAWARGHCEEVSGGDVAIDIQPSSCTYLCLLPGGGTETGICDADLSKEETCNLISDYTDVFCQTDSGADEISLSDAFKVNILGELYACDIAKTNTQCGGSLDVRYDGGLYIKEIMGSTFAGIVTENLTIRGHPELGYIYANAFAEVAVSGELTLAELPKYTTIFKNTFASMESSLSKLAIYSNDGLRFLFSGIFNGLDAATITVHNNTNLEGNGVDVNALKTLDAQSGFTLEFAGNLTWENNGGCLPFQNQGDILFTAGSDLCVAPSPTASPTPSSSVTPSITPSQTPSKAPESSPSETPTSLATSTPSVTPNSSDMLERSLVLVGFESSTCSGSPGFYHTFLGGSDACETISSDDEVVHGRAYCVGESLYAEVCTDSTCSSCESIILTVGGECYSAPTFAGQSFATGMCGATLDSGFNTNQNGGSRTFPEVYAACIAIIISILGVKLA